MTLTPEDVLNKNFTPTQFRRGYDEREVDDFLDEVVAEMRKLVKDSDDLRDQLNDCRQSKGMPAVAKPDPDAVARTGWRDATVGHADAAGTWRHPATRHGAVAPRIDAAGHGARRSSCRAQDEHRYRVLPHCHPI